MAYFKRIQIGLFLLFILLKGMAQVDFTADFTEGCTPLSVLFTISPMAADTVERVDWYFGSGDTITTQNPDTITHVFRESGVFTVVMVLNGYRSEAIVKENYITVHRTVRSVFRYEEYAEGNNYRFIPEDTITDPGSYYFQWSYIRLSDSSERFNYYNVNTSNQESAIDPVALDTGTWRVTLTIEDEYGCSSHYSEIVNVPPQILIPNIFLPAHEVNYIIDPKNINTVLKFQVFNRNGLLVFSQTSPVINWDGKTNSGSELNTGVYFYILESVSGDPLRRFQSREGFIHLYR